MTIQEYIDNPMGKGDASVINRKIIKESMISNFHRYEEKKGKQVKSHPFVTVNGEYYFLLVLPTETERDNSYDVVFHFFDREKKFLSSKSIKDYDVKMFSNDPSFGYTFAYVYNKNGMMVESLIPKLGKKFVTSPPKTRNKFEVVNYNKYIFYGAMILLERKYLTRLYLTSHATTYSSKLLVSKVRTLETIMNQYHIAERNLMREKRYVKHEEKRAKQKEKARSTNSNRSGVHEIGKKQKNSNRISPKAKIKKK